MMKKPALLFIQGGGDGAYNEDKKLSSFLNEALKDICIVKHPEIPNERDPEYKNYKAIIHEELNKIDTKVILVAHSVGACFLLKYLSETKIDKDIIGLFLIATPFWGNGGWQYDGFSLKGDFASTLPANIPIFFYHGTKDEVVPFSHLALYKQKLPGATFRKIDGAGHQLNNNLSEVVQDIRNLDVQAYTT